MKTYQIKTVYGCFGIDVKNGVVEETAPIAKWMKGKNINTIKNWVEKKNGSIQILDNI